MSELKVYAPYDYSHEPDRCPSLVYDKSEVDKVIANRDYEIKKLKDTIGKLLKAKTEQIIDEVMQKALIYGDGFVRVEDMMKLIAELHHQKFMRCNILIDYCGLKQNTCEEEKVPFWRKWYLRWCELSDKFKEAK